MLSFLKVRLKLTYLYVLWNGLHVFEKFVVGFVLMWNITFTVHDVELWFVKWILIGYFKNAVKFMQKYRGHARNGKGPLQNV